MKDELITFDTAKLAKEKGFDWKVRYSFGHKINPHIAYPKEDYSISCDFNSPNVARNWKDLCSAPTQSLLQKWLREVHEIRVDVYAWYHFPFYAFNLFKGRNLTNLFNIEWAETNEFHKEKGTSSTFTYEEALECGLQEALKLI